MEVSIATGYFLSCTQKYSRIFNNMAITIFKNSENRNLNKFMIKEKI